MLSKSFKAGKCKTSLKMAVARIKLLKNKREVQLKQMKRDLAQLLESGQNKTAMIRVEHVVREEKTMAAYDIVELYSELIVARLPIIESQKNCPIDLKEAISSIIFASPRCADIPELLDIRKHFTVKYGKEFINAALELRPDCGVNRMIIEKLSAKTPDAEAKIKILTAIAQEHNVKWDQASLEEQVFKPPEDLLNGPSKFVSASMMHLESPNVQFHPSGSQVQKPPSTSHEDDIISSSSSSTPFSSGNMSTSIPTTRPGLRASESRAKEGDHQHPFYKDESASSNRQGWNMEFKDATSAAQAAAESAERASIAARAAAELSRGNFTREYATESQRPSFYGPRDEGHERTGSQMMDERLEHSVRMEDDPLSGPIGRSLPRALNKQRGEVENRHPLGAAERRYQGRGSVERRSSQSTSQINVTSIHEEASVGRQGADELPRNSSSEVESVNLKRRSKDFEKEEFHREVSTNKQLSQSASSHSSMASFNDDISAINLQDERTLHKGRTEQESDNQKQPGEFAFTTSSISPIDDDVIWVTNVREYEDDADHSISMGWENAQIDAEQAGPNDYPAAVFDNSDSDYDSHFELGNHGDRHGFDSYFSPEGSKSPSHILSNRDSWDLMQERSGSLPKQSSSEEPEVVTGPRPSAMFSEGFPRTTVLSESSDLPATFDDSDDPASENEVHGFKLRERMSQSNHGLADSSFDKNETTGSNRKTWSHASSDDLELEDRSKVNQKAELNIVSERRSSSERGPKSPQKSNDSAKEPFYSSVIEEQQSMQSLKFPSSQSIQQDQVKFSAPTLSASTTERNFSNNLNNESGGELNLGRLTGGFRNKGKTRPPYIRGRPGDDSNPSKQSTMDETPTILDAPANLCLENASMSTEANNAEAHRQKPRANIHKESSPITFFDSDSDDAKEPQPRRPIDNSGYRGGMLSRRTRGSPSHSAMGGPSRLTWRSEVSTISNVGAGSRPFKQSSSTEEPFSKPPSQSPESNSSPEQPSKQLPQAETSTHRESLKSSRPNLATEQPSQHFSDPVMSASRENSKLSSLTARSTLRENSQKTDGNIHPKLPDHDSWAKSKLSSLTVRSASREKSQKTASHIHPKLPDYDSLAAHFESLRSDRPS